MGALILALNGNEMKCGWGYTGNWVNPNSALCDGVYAYDDETCDVECIITEGIYWTLLSILGSQNYTVRANEIANEWLMAYPTIEDESQCQPQPHCRVMNEYAPDLYALFNHEEWKWIPSKLPNGTYSKLNAANANRSNWEKVVYSVMMLMLLVQ